MPRIEETPALARLPGLSGRPLCGRVRPDALDRAVVRAGAVSWAGCIYKVDKRHRQVGIDNLARAFGDQYTDAERDRDRAAECTAIFA